MAAAKVKDEVKEYRVVVKDNPGYCGTGAGGAQFAHGEAHITNKNLAGWFATHEGYEVEGLKTES